MTGWTVTGVAAHLADAVHARDRWMSRSSLARATRLAQRADGTVYARVASRRIAASTPADRKALETALAEMGPDRAVGERAVASGAPIAAVAGLAARWAGMPTTAQGWIRGPAGRGVGPVAWGAVHLTQVDQTTCGAASMVMAAMIADPFVALWMATGQTIAAYAPVEVARAIDADGAVQTVAQRWAALQRAMHRATTRAALGPLPWPRALGTPPWRVDNELRCAGLRYRGMLVDDASDADVAAALAHIGAAVRDGISVPIYVGGDSTQGLQGVVPRHVVLAVRRDEGRTHVYEPGSGAVHAVADAELTQPHGRLAAFGNWSRMEWVILPRPRR